MAVIKLNQGMTLIELMIVIAILGIISAIAIPAYTGYIKTARIQECQQEVASLALAQEEYFLEKRAYFEGTTTALIETASDGLWRPAEPDINKRNCEYSIKGNTDINNSYTITATGSNKLSLELVVLTKSK